MPRRRRPTYDVVQLSINTVCKYIHVRRGDGVYEVHLGVRRPTTNTNHQVGTHNYTYALRNPAPKIVTSPSYIDLRLWVLPLPPPETKKTRIVNMYLLAPIPPLLKAEPLSIPGPCAQPVPVSPPSARSYPDPVDRTDQPLGRRLFISCLSHRSTDTGVAVISRSKWQSILVFPSFQHHEQAEKNANVIKTLTPDGTQSSNST